MKKDLKNNKIGKLFVAELSKKDKHNKYVWKCICECGNISYVTTGDLLSGKVKSCGCLKRENTIKIFTTHNKTHTKIYNTYNNMKQRCYNKKSPKYKYYGGRGITICEEWKNDFEKFYNWSVNNGYKENLTIDRINVNGDYEPNNCRWVTQKTQSVNKRNNRFITYDGQTLTIKEWSEKLNIPYTRITTRLYRGVPISELFEPPERKRCNV